MAGIKADLLNSAGIKQRSLVSFWQKELKDALQVFFWGVSWVGNGAANTHNTKRCWSFKWQKKVRKVIIGQHDKTQSFMFKTPHDNSSRKILMYFSPDIKQSTYILTHLLIAMNSELCLWSLSAQDTIYFNQDNNFLTLSCILLEWFCFTAPSSWRY